MAKKGRPRKPRASKRPSGTGQASTRSSALVSLTSANAAFENFERAQRVAQRDRSDFGAQVKLLLASLEAAEYKTCRQVIEHLTRRWPQRDDARLIASQAWETMGELNQAAEVLGADRQIPATAPELVVQYAHLMERLHRLDSAIEALAEIPADCHCKAESQVVLAEVLLRQRKDDLAVETLQALFRGNKNAETVRVRAGYLLARCYDRLSEFQRAFEILRDTKRIQQVEKSNWIAAARQSVLQHLALARHLEPRHFESPSTPTSPLDRSRAPQVHLVGGFPRSGTTLIESALLQHSALQTLEETPIFTQSVLHPLTKRYGELGGPTRMLEAATQNDFDQAREIYLRRAGEYLGSNVVSANLIDKNPILTPAAPFFMRVFASSKVLVCCRDPRDVLLSNFFLYPGEMNSFNAHHTHLVDLAKWLQIHWDCSLRLRQVQPNRTRFVRYEDTIHSFESTLQNVLEFFDLPWESSVLEYRARATDRPARSPSYAEVAKPLYSSAVGRWHNYAEYLEPAIRHLSSAIAAWESVAHGS